MAKSIWYNKEDKEAFEEGRLAAAERKPRKAFQHHRTYNERAAFNDGWDTFHHSAPTLSRRNVTARQDDRASSRFSHNDQISKLIRRS